MAMPLFLSKEDNSIVYNGNGTFVLFVPSFFFQKKYAEFVGENINIFGVLDYAIYDEKGNIEKTLTNFNLPTVFQTRPSNTETKSNIKLTKNSKAQDYVLFKYSKGDPIIVSHKVPQSIENVEILFKMMISGNMPTTIPYNKIHEYWENSMRLNGSKFGVSMQLFGIFSSEIFRKSDDKMVPFRLSGEKDMTKYQPITVKMIPNLITPFTAFISENWDESMIYASMNKNKKEVPLEKIIMM